MNIFNTWKGLTPFSINFIKFGTIEEQTQIYNITFDNKQIIPIPDEKNSSI